MQAKREYMDPAMRTFGSAGICGMLAVLLIACMFLPLKAQDYQRVTEIVVHKDGRQLLSPWAGGLNAPQIGEADFNNDGQTDLFFYDEDGEWRYVFIYVSNDTYIYEPVYAEGMPDYNDWLIMRDYNCDGITDMITHGNQGAPRTYLGYYEDGRLKFAADKDIIYYETSSLFSVNLYTIGTHRPAFEDVNGDGDLDFLSYDVSLTRIYYYENLREERNLPCDSLYFKRIDRCWGAIRETGISLTQTLGDTCDFRFFRTEDPDTEQPQHPGGTALALYDEDGNGVQDLLLADFTYNQINFLRNNGTPGIANLYEQDDSFPSYDQPLDIAIFPAPHMIDVDKDGFKDILAAPFNAGAVDNYENVAYYRNNGSNFEPFRFVRNDFLVGDMIEVGELAAPAFFDYNSDGLLDLVIGNGGYYEDGGSYLYTLTLYENTGTMALPEYTFRDRDYLGLSTFEVTDLTPYFADMDNDGDQDFFAGEAGGKILFAENIGGNFPNIGFLNDDMGTNIDIGQSSRPTLVDLDKNGTFDLAIGTRDGNVVYYENTGTVDDPEFTFRTETLGGVQSHPANSQVRYSCPAFGDFDRDGYLDLLLGGADSRMKLYSDIGIAYDATFELTDDNFFNADHFAFSPGDVLPRINPASADISNDGLDEVVIGTNTGGLILMSQELSDTTILASNYTLVSDLVSVYPNPAGQRLNLEWENAFDAGSAVSISVSDALGRLIRREMISNTGSLAIDVRTLPPGIYNATLQQGRRLGTVRFIIQR